jgi:hypothetical protein
MDSRTFKVKSGVDSDGRGLSANRFRNDEDLFAEVDRSPAKCLADLWLLESNTSGDPNRFNMSAKCRIGFLDGGDAVFEDSAGRFFLPRPKNIGNASLSPCCLQQRGKCLLGNFFV